MIASVNTPSWKIRSDNSAEGSECSSLEDGLPGHAWPDVGTAGIRDYSRGRRRRLSGNTRSRSL